MPVLPPSPPPPPPAGPPPPPVPPRRMPPPLPTNRVFCPVDPRVAPNADNGLSGAFTSLKTYFPGTHPVLAIKAAGALAQMAQSGTLYVIAHGNATKAVFSVGDNVELTAIDMAQALQQAGLPLTHRQIVLMVCHAGDSIGLQSEIDALQEQRERALAHSAASEAYRAQQKFGKSIEEDDKYQAIRKPLNRVLERWDPRRLPELTQDDEKRVKRFDYVLPLVAQLVQQLKNLGYDQFRMRAFNGEVSNNVDGGIKVVNYATRPGDAAQERVKVEVLANAANSVEWL